MLDPESEQIRELYALYGLAMNVAQNLERELAMLLAVFDSAGLMTAWDYDARLAENFDSTFGTLATRFQDLSKLQYEELNARLSKAVGDRNDLAHHYFWDRAVQFNSSNGRAQMIAELDAMRERFEALDEELTALARECAGRRGMSAEALKANKAACIAELLSGSKDKYDPKLAPNPVEIIAVYESRYDRGSKYPLVFASRDGRYLILGEKGLCYGPQNISLEELVVKEPFEKALPAEVNPRPKKSAPWNFAITLANGYILRVRQENVDGQARIRFGLRKLRPIKEIRTTDKGTSEMKPI